MDIKKFLDNSSFRKVEDDFNNIFTIEYWRNFHHIGGSNITYIKFNEGKIYVLQLVTAYEGCSPYLVHIFESVVTQKEFIDSLKTININSWKSEYPCLQPFISGEGFYIGIKTNDHKLYWYRGRGNFPEGYREFAELIGILFNSVRNLKMFGVDFVPDYTWCVTSLENYIENKRIKKPKGKEFLKFDEDYNSVDGKLSDIDQWHDAWRHATSYVVEIVDNKPVKVNNYNKYAIAWNEYFRGENCRKAGNYELALKYYLSSISIYNLGWGEKRIQEMVDKGYIDLGRYPEVRKVLEG